MAPVGQSGFVLFCFSRVVSIRDGLNARLCLGGVVLNSVACCQSQSLNHVTLYLEHFILTFFFHYLTFFFIIVRKWKKKSYHAIPRNPSLVLV